MLFSTLASLALATGLAAAKPVFSPKAEELPAYRRSTPAVHKRGANNGFNFIDGFNNFNNQEQVIQVQQENLQIVDNGRQQAVVEQAKQVLIVNQQNNGFNNDLNNLFRKSNARRNNNDVSTVMLVVQEIQVSVDDGQGNSIQSSLFAQSAVVANRGRGVTETIMMFAAETLVAQNILNGNNNNGFGGVAGVGAGNATLPTQTAGVQLLGAKPTWSSVAADPAATLGGVWQAELQDAQDVSNNAADSSINDAAAKAIAAALGQ